MTIYRQPYDGPGPVTERLASGALAEEARRIDADLAAMDVAIAAIEKAHREADSIQHRFTGKRARDWRLIVLHLEDSLIDARAERDDLNASITRELEDA